MIGQPVRLEVYPPTIKLTSARQRMQLVVTGHYRDGSTQDLTRVATAETNSPRVATCTNGVVAPAGDGNARVTVRVGGFSADVAVAVSGQAGADPVSFRYAVIPALTQKGCNAGACHGSPSGKGNLSLSMLGYNPEADFVVLVRSDRNRRCNVMEPEPQPAAA